MVGSVGWDWFGLLGCSGDFEMSDLNRRQFVVAAVGAVCAGCLCDAESFAAEAPAGKSSKPIDVGTKEDYPKDGTVNDKFTMSDRILVIRNEGKIYALNSTCPHRSKTVKKGKDDLVCPSHGSHFSLYGTVTKGPAKSSMTRYAISLNDKGHLIVDKSKQFEEKHWDDEGASITA